jgi:phage gp29-like protein
MLIPVDPIPQLTAWNPLRGLTLPRLMQYIELGELGSYAEIQWIYRHVERRNPTVRAIKRKLMGSLRSLDWKINIPDNLPDDKKALAEKQKEKLQAAYRRVTNLKEAIVHLALADFRGFAHCNKIYRDDDAPAPLADPAWDVTELRIVPQWFMSRRGSMTAWTYSPGAKFGIAAGTPIQPGDWVVHEEDQPVSEIFAKCHVQSEATDADWDAFLETYGMPAIFVEGPPGVPKEKESEYAQTAENIVGDGRGYLPNGSKVHSVDAPNGQSKVFDDRLGYLQKLMVLAGTGGILSMLAEPTGIGKGASDSHDDTWLTIAAGVAEDVSETLQEQFDKPELQRWFGEDVEILAYFDLSRPEKFDPTVLSTNAKAWRDAGFMCDAEEMSEKAGVTLTPVLPPTETPAAAGELGSNQSSVPSNQSGGAAQSSTPQAGSGASRESGTAGSAATPPASSPSPASAASSAAKPAESAASPQAGSGAPSSDLPSPNSGDAAAPGAFLAEEPTLATNPRPSQTGEAKPSILTSALADAADVDAKTFAPIAPLLNALELLAKHGAPPEAIESQIQSTIDALPEILGHIDPSVYADALEKALGPAAVQGVRDALSARQKGAS